MPTERERVEQEIREGADDLSRAIGWANRKNGNAMLIADRRHQRAEGAREVAYSPTPFPDPILNKSGAIPSRVYVLGYEKGWSDCISKIRKAADDLKVE